MKKKTIILCLLILIILIQVITRIVIANQKVYLHMDEAYSYGLMNQNKLNVTDREDFYEKWHSKEYFLDYLSVNEGEKRDWKPVYENQKNDVHPPFYYLLLRTVASFTIDYFSKWTGIIINIIFYVFSAILIFLIAKRLFKNSYIALFACFITGLTNIALEGTLYIRMYELCTFMILLTTYLHLRNIGKKELNWKNGVAIIIPVCIGFLTHYYFLLFLMGLYILYMFLYAKQKNYKNMIKYTICLLIAGGIGLLIFPHAISHIFFGYRGQGAIQNFFNINSFILNIGIYIVILNQKVFHYIGILLFIVIGYQKVKNKIKFTENTTFLILLLPTMCYFLLSSQVSPYKDFRYMIPIYPMIVLLTMYAFYRCFKEKTAIIAIACVFIVMLKISVPLEYTFSKYQDIVVTIEEKPSIPALYIFNPSQNRFLDDITLFSKIEKSCIIKQENATEEKLKGLLEGKDKMYLFLNEGMDNTSILEKLEEYSQKHIKRMNACDIYLLEKEPK